jgi:hypothetical protein
MDPSGGGSLQQVQRVPFEAPVSRELTAEPTDGFSIRQHIVPQEEHRILERCEWREFFHGESANEELSLFSIHGADRGPRRDDGVEPRPVRR